jgi:peptidyl-tRNA hydrolase, PTH1 family
VFHGKQRTGTPSAWLVIGLGNPGLEYARTRHNIGADVVALLADRHGGRLKVGRERALSGDVKINHEVVTLAFPQTFMNLSGESARLLVDRHGISDVANVIVVHDELDLPSGRVKLKVGGGTGGHNGLKSLQAHLHSPLFIRVRIGIGRPPGTQASADYVLAAPGKAERAELDVAVQVAADAVESIVALGVDKTMNAVNTAGS